MPTSEAKDTNVQGSRSGRPATLKTFQYRMGTGWNEPLDGSLNSTSTLVFAFGSSGIGPDETAVRDLATAFPDSHVIGCSTAGEILGSLVMDGSLVVAVMKLERTRVASATAPVRGPQDSRLAGRLLAEQLVGPSLKAVFVLSDGLNVNGSDLVAGLNEVLPKDVVVTGGLAGDGTAFKRTWTLHRGTQADHMVSTIALYGDHVVVGHASRGGWDVFGPERRITRAEGNVLFELDGLPALDLYKQYLGDRAAGLPSSALLFPLRITPSAASDVQLVRTVLSVDEAAKSMTFAGDMPVGASAQLMRANFDRLISAAGESSLRARRGVDTNSPTLTLAISCVGRRLILGERTEEELEAAAEPQQAGDQQIGFYSYGELSPFATGRCDLHNQTMTITTIREQVG